MSKYCPKCDTTKPHTAWGKNQSKKDGLSSYCKTCSTAAVKDTINKNPGHKKQYDFTYSKVNRDRIASREVFYRQSRKDVTANQAKLRRQDPQEKAAHRIRRNLRGRLLSGKNDSYFADWGCTVGEMKEHISRQFIEGMCWENYGRDGWSLDHITPLSSFNLTDAAEAAKASHWTNVQPLWFGDNVRKHKKLR